MKTILISLLCLLLSLSGFSQTRYFVKHDAGGENDGSSWTDAFTNLQAAIDATNNDDIIWVAGGTYAPTTELGGSGERFRTFQMKNGVAIYGGFAGTEDPNDFDLDDRDFDANETILSGDLGGGVHVYHVFRHVDLSLDNTAVLDGFTISGGKADGSDLDNKGGGMLNAVTESSESGSSPTIRNCIFTNNEAGEGGAIYNSRYSSPEIRNTIFENNTATDIGGAVYMFRNETAFYGCTFLNNTADGTGSDKGGGAVYVRTVDDAEGVSFTDCLFSGNTVNKTSSGARGGAIHASIDKGYVNIGASRFLNNKAQFGGAVYVETGNESFVEDSEIAIVSSTFDENSAEFGGAIFNERHNISVTTCIIRGNLADDSGGGYYSRFGSSELVNSLVSGNKAVDQGGGIYFNDETAKLINTTVSGNYANGFGGGIRIIGSSDVSIKNTILWGNVSNDDGNELSLCSGCNVSIDYSLYGNNPGDVQITETATLTETNSLTEDPLFFIPLAPDASNTPNTSGVYMIKEESPAVDKGLNAHIDGFGVTKDLRGGPRIVAGNGDATIDIGAYEYNPTCSSNPPIAGTGTDTDPYLIAEPGNFCWMAQNPADWNKHYKQITAINLTGSEDLDGGKGLRPIGNSTTGFTGSYNGQGFSISNLTINRPDESNVGLFGVIDGQSAQRVVLQNINLVDVNITGSREVGALVGLAEQFNEITNCHVSGTVKGSRNTGGLVGWGRRTDFLRCSSSAVVLLTPASFALYHGGLIGHINATSTVKESYATGDVSGRGRVGGLIGAIGWNSSVEDSYARGNVSSEGLTAPMIGGLIGEVWNAGVRRSFSTGEVDKEGLTGDFGGLVGTKVTDNHFFDDNNFWDTGTSGVVTSVMGTGKTTTEMKDEETFTDWDFSDTWDLDPLKNDGYPYLRENSGDCQNPTDGGIIASSQLICPGTSPQPFVSESGASGHTGLLEYQWEISISSPTFSAIPGTNSVTYTHTGTVTQTTWFRRRARVTCDPVDWEDTVSSNVVMVSVLDEPSVTDIEIDIDPELNITRFDKYTLTADVDLGGKTIKDVSFVIRPQTASETNLNWDFLTNGTPYPNPNVPFKEVAANTENNSWSFDKIRPDDIYPEIAFIFDITEEPSNSNTWRDSYDLMHFTNPFEMREQTSFFIELYATPNLGSSRVLQVYLVGSGFDISDFENIDVFANEAWQDHPNVELVGSINRDQDFHHEHGPYSKHFVIPLSTNADGQIGNKNIDISGDFWLILYTGHPLENRRWNLKYHPGCDNNGTWWKGSGTEFDLQEGCPDVHVHFAREMPIEPYNQMEVYVEVEYEENGTICTLQSAPEFFSFAELPNLPPNPSSFIGPDPGTYQGEVTISWIPATDPNNDPVTYNVRLIGEGGTVTNTLAEGLEVTSITFDSSQHPDGEYDILVEACDAEFCTGFRWSSNVDEEEGEFFGILNGNFDLTLFLQGPYNTTTGQMNTTLRDADMLPKRQPYNVEPWQYNGTEAFDPIPENAVDWVLVEIRSDETTPVAQRAGMLLSDGSLSVNFDNDIAPTDELYVVIYHRNHLPIMSAEKLTIPTAEAFNMSVKEQLRENVAIELETGVYGLIAGNLRRNDRLRYGGPGNDRGIIIPRIVEEFDGPGDPNLSSIVTGGYWFEDAFLDNRVSYIGGSNDRDIIMANIAKLTGVTWLNAVFVSPVPAAIKTADYDYRTDGPVSIFIDAQQIAIDTDRQIAGGIVDNIQFTLAWNTGDALAEEALSNFSSGFHLMPQGEPVNTNGISRQVFASVVPVRLPFNWQAGDVLPVMNFETNISSNIWLTNCDFAQEHNGLYYLSIWGADNTGHVKEADTPTGIDDPAADGLTVFPNPVREGIIHLVIPDMGGQEMDVAIYDLEGRLVNHPGQTTDNTEMAIDVSKLHGGVYIIKTSNTQMQQHIRFVIYR